MTQVYEIPDHIPMGIIAAGQTDIGMKRKTNQDAIYLNSRDHLYVVADGMGGHSGGDVASSLAVQHLPKFFFDNISKSEELKEHFITSVKYANKKILLEASKRPELKGMGTTIVGMFFHKAELFIANVGDSRCYMVNNSQLFQLTRDHSLVQEKINMGIYNREEAVKDIMKNVLVRTVGYEDNVEVDIFNYRVSRNDIFLLCSDGLHSKVSDRDILHIINHHIPTPQSATKEDLQNLVTSLINQANANGGNDNISVIIALAQ